MKYNLGRPIYMMPHDSSWLRKYQWNQWGQLPSQRDRAADLLTFNLYTDAIKRHTKVLNNVRTP